MNIKIDASPLSEEEKMFLSKNYVAFDLNEIEILNNTIGFKFYKLYVDNLLTGYAAFFLGYNGLESNDVSIEDVVYLGEPDYDDYPLVYLLYQIKSNPILGFKIENVFYDSSKFSEMYLDVFEKLGFKSMALTR